MKIKMIDGCNLYMINRKDFSVITIDPEDATVRFDNKRPIYEHKKQKFKDRIIVQAFTHRYALSKVYEILKNENISN